MLSPRKKIRLSEVAEAIGTTFKSVRHWFSKYQDRGVVPGANQSGYWLEFSWSDVATCAVAKYLVDIGMPAFEAFDRSKATLQELFPALFEREPRWVRKEGLCQIILGRDRSGDWVTNDPDVKCPLRVIVNVDQIIYEAFESLSDMGHEPPIDNIKATNQLANDLMSKRLRRFLVRLRQLKSFQADAEANLHTITNDILKMQKEAAADNPDEASWMAELALEMDMSK